MQNHSGSSFSRSASFSLLLFGVTIGVITALSETKGTVVTLLGLLFALVGGSLVSIYRADSGLNGPRRDALFCGAGFISGGILLGIALGLFLVFAEQRWFPGLMPRGPAPLRVPGQLQTPATNRPGAVDARRDTPKDTPSSELPGRPRVTSLQGAETDRMKALRTALRTQLGDASISATERTVLGRLGALLADTNFINTVTGAAKTVELSTNLNDEFKENFKKTFGSLDAQK